MTEFFKLINSSIEIAREYRTGEFKRRTFPVLSGASYCIYQKYSTIPFDLCFWELHQDFVDVNVWLDGEEKLQSSSALYDLSSMTFSGDDFWTTKETLSIKDTVILSKSRPVVVFNANIPHKCQIQNNSGYIEKLTLKIHRSEFDRLT